MRLRCSTGVRRAAVDHCSGRLVTMRLPPESISRAFRRILEQGLLEKRVFAELLLNGCSDPVNVHETDEYS